MDGCHAAGKEAGDGEGHRQAVIVEAVGWRADEGAAAVDPHVVAVDVDPDAEGPKAARRAVDPVGLLVAQLTRAAEQPQTLVSVEQTANIGGGTIWNKAALDEVAEIDRSSLERTTRSATGSPTPSSAAPVPAPARLPLPLPSIGRSSIRAPIARRMSMIARRVGLTPTLRSVSSASGCVAPATSQNAAAEMSPGTRSLTVPTLDPPSRLTAAPPPSVSVRTSTPRARSIRSV